MAHSGRAGPILWHTRQEYVERTLRVLEVLAERYGRYDCLVGLSTLNEPDDYRHVTEIPRPVLKDFWEEAYRRMRRHLDPDRISVVVDGHFVGADWIDFMQPSEFSNVVVDRHLYSACEIGRPLPNHFPLALA